MLHIKYLNSIWGTLGSNNTIYFFSRCYHTRAWLLEWATLEALDARLLRCPLVSTWRGWRPLSMCAATALDARSLRERAARDLSLKCHCSWFSLSLHSFFRAAFSLPLSAFLSAPLSLSVRLSQEVHHLLHFNPEISVKYLV